MDEEGYPDRIISDSERKNLETLLLSQNLNYPNYKKWVSKTVKEVELAEKIAFGFFTSAKEIVGDGIIRITASKTVDLKNFFLKEDSRKRGSGSKLLEYIENYCIENGCTQISVDMSIECKDVIKFFINHDYKFQARGDFYGNGMESYLMVKKLPAKYIGNYDWITISNWVMERIFGYRLVNQIDDKHYIYSTKINDVNFTTTMVASDDLDQIQDDVDIKNLFKSANVKGNLLYFAPYFNSPAKIFAKKNGITLIDRERLEKLSGFNLPSSSKDTAGLIVVIKPEYFEKLIQNKDRVFLKGGSAPSRIENHHVLLFYVTSPTQAIGGYAQIKKITSDSPSEIWRKYSRQSAFTEEDYKTYTEGKTTVTAYSFEDIKKLDHSISLSQIRKVVGSFNHQAGQRISTEECKIIKNLF